MKGSEKRWVISEKRGRRLKIGSLHNFGISLSHQVFNQVIASAPLSLDLIPLGKEIQERDPSHGGKQSPLPFLFFFWP